MKSSIKIVAAAAFGLLLGLPGAYGGEPSPIYMFINLGSVGNELRVYPPEFTLKAGEVYRFVISNPSESIHVVSAAELQGTASTTEVVNSTSSVTYPASALTKGIALGPGEMLEWTFTPRKQGTYKFGCATKEHAAVGMRTIVNVVL